MSAEPKEDIRFRPVDKEEEVQGPRPLTEEEAFQAFEKDLISRVIIDEGTATDTCAYLAIQNLAVKCGLEPPTFQRMRDLWRGPQEHEGLSVADQMVLLSELGFPSMVALGVIPHGQTARDVFPPLLDAGFNLLANVWFVAQVPPPVAEEMLDKDYGLMPFYTSHVVVPYGYTDDHLKVIVGWRDCKVFNLSWQTLPYFHWGDSRPQGIGIGREFVITWPLRKQQGDERQ